MDSKEQLQVQYTTVYKRRIRADDRLLPSDVAKSSCSMKSLIFAGLLLCLLTAAATSMSGHVSGAAAAAAAEVNDGGTSSWGNQLPDMLVSYFRQHGVHSLMLVVCHGDIGELRALCDSTPTLFPHSGWLNL